MDPSINDRSHVRNKRDSRPIRWFFPSVIHHIKIWGGEGFVFDHIFFIIWCHWKQPTLLILSLTITFNLLLVTFEAAYWCVTGYCEYVGVRDRSGGVIFCTLVVGVWLFGLVDFSVFFSLRTKGGKARIKSRTKQINGITKRRGRFLSILSIQIFSLAKTRGGETSIKSSTTKIVLKESREVIPSEFIFDYWGSVSCL